ncbi:hypothetical protein [Deinococcus pimensis]|uniref:hypothetical protein n=1 Tax=Deinococcus pimensis TaxID=309888 RepID=UPI0005EAEAD6|nr:hypothetical protein [Deinococcus pimensis]
MILRNIHAYYGEFLQLIPILVLIWAVFFRTPRVPFQRIAPVMLDVNVLLGLLVYFLTPIKVSVWHPVAMITAVIVAHAVARQQNRAVLIGAWVVVLALLVVGVLIAKGTISV